MPSATILTIRKKYKKIKNVLDLRSGIQDRFPNFSSAETDISRFDPKLILAHRVSEWVKMSHELLIR